MGVIEVNDKLGDSRPGQDGVIPMSQRADACHLGETTHNGTWYAAFLCFGNFMNFVSVNGVSTTAPMDPGLWLRGHTCIRRGQTSCLGLDTVRYRSVLAIIRQILMCYGSSRRISPACSSTTGHWIGRPTSRTPGTMEVKLNGSSSLTCNGV